MIIALSIIGLVFLGLIALLLGVIAWLLVSEYFWPTPEVESDHDRWARENSRRARELREQEQRDKQ